MKAVIILLNLGLSFIGLTVDTETAPLWIILTLLVWFILSTLLFAYSCRKGWFNEIIKHYKIDEL